MNSSPLTGRFGSLARFLAALVITGCSNGNGIQGGGTDGGSPLPANTISASIGPITVASGQETVMCATMHLPNTEDIDVVRITTTLAPGSHHLVLYRSDATVEAPPTACRSFDGVFRGEAPIFIAESAHSDMVLPSEAAYHFPAGQMVRLEAHYINATPSTLQGMGKVQLVPGDKGKTYQPADIMMCGSVVSLSCEAQGGLDPGMASTTLPVGFYNGNGVGLGKGGNLNTDLTKLKFFAFTSHEHHRGIDVKVWKSTNASPKGDPIFDNPSWDNPPLQTYTDANLLTFGPNEGFAWQCSYDTSMDTQKVCFGESANDEMCFIWAYYYPSVGRFIAMDDCWFN